MPYKITTTVQQCAIYVDVRVTPAQNPLDVREELRRLVADCGLAGEVELYVYRPAYEADNLRTDPHSPGRYRVNGSVANFSAFAEAFHCPAGAPLAPVNRCDVW